MPRPSDAPPTAPRSKPAPAHVPPPDQTDEEARESTDEGMLDLDDHDQINNQHLEVR